MQMSLTSLAVGPLPRWATIATIKHRNMQLILRASRVEVGCYAVFLAEYWEVFLAKCFAVFLRRCNVFASVGLCGYLRGSAQAIPAKYSPSILMIPHWPLARGQKLLVGLWKQQNTDGLFNLPSPSRSHEPPNGKPASTVRGKQSGKYLNILAQSMKRPYCDVECWSAVFELQLKATLLRE